ncbi:MAG: mercury resistance system transport protein MerF [Phaeovulum sp.]|nr:mercury resistance system transport protein MerF [Phaeovulum sp.]MDP2062393.1 mercury resistance system transport protein MerF [Phaeovulum sp.]
MPPDRRLLKTGIIGSVLLALCCFTPILVVLFGVVGLSALLGWLDYVLLPALGFFVGLTVYALWRRQRRAKPL